jgi:predicted RNase H-like HicB family nuclease
MKRNDMSTDVKLLSRPVNFAVVQLPGRQFPGVVVQGDTLHSLVQRVDELLQLLRSGDVDELSAGISNISEQLTEAKTHYEIVCAGLGIRLPYNK